MYACIKTVLIGLPLYTNDITVCLYKDGDDWPTNNITVSL